MKWKRFFLENLGTKFMAFFLALLLWIYLYNEATESGEFEIAFMPSIQETNLVDRSTVFLNSKGEPIQQTILVKITGPKGELSGLSKKGIRCEPRFEKALFKEDQGTIQRDLTVHDLNLPEGFRVDFRPSAQIRMSYVKFTTKKIKVILPPTVDGSAALDYEVGEPRITNPPDQTVDVRMPATETLKELRLRRVTLVGSPSETFRTAGLLDTSDENIQLKSEITIEVPIKLKTTKRPFDLDLALAGDPAVTNKIQLVTKKLKVDVEGPVSLMEKLESATQLFAFVIATDAEVGNRQPGTRFQLTRIHCLVLDEGMRKELTITIMPGVNENDKLVDAVVK